MKKIVCLTAVLLLCASMLVGCAKDKTQTNEPQNEEPEIVKNFDLEQEQFTAVNISPYEGLYLEDGSKETVSGIYAIQFTNNADRAVRDAQLIFSDGTQELSFHLEMVPAGASIIVAEENKTAVTSEALNYVDGHVEYLEVGTVNNEAVKVTSNGDGTVVVENTTEDMLPLVRVFYRPTDKDGNMLGGACQSAMVDGIEAGAASMADAAGWDASTVVSMVLIVNE